MKLHWHVERLTLREPLRISRASMTARDAVRVGLEHQGVTGYGEVVTSVHLGLDLPRIIDLLNGIAGRIAACPDPESLGADLPATSHPPTSAQGGPSHPPAGAAGGPAHLPAGASGGPAGAMEVLAGAPGVLAALDAALHDLAGKLAGTPAHRLLGLSTWTPVATAYTIGLMPVRRAAVIARDRAAAGFQLLKVKAGDDDDRARVAAVRAAAPHVRLLLDPNGAWSPEQTVRMLDALAAYRLDGIEQPIPPGRPDRLAWITARSPVPVIADEDAADLADLPRLAGAVTGVNIKLARCGGMRAALAGAATARRYGLDVMFGCLVASSLGIAPAVHLANLARWVDLDGHLLLADDPWQGIGGHDGTLRLSGAPGLGVHPAELGPARDQAEPGPARDQAEPGPARDQAEPGPGVHPAPTEQAAVVDAAAEVGAR